MTYVHTLMEDQIGKLVQIMSKGSTNAARSRDGDALDGR